METWAQNFLVFCLITACIVAFVPARLKLLNASPVVRALVRVPFTIAVMSIVGALLALLAHVSNPRLLEAINKDILGALAYFFEIGWETGVFWLPIGLITISILAWRDFKRGDNAGI